MFADKCRVQVHGLLTANLVADAAGVDRSLVVFELDRDLVDVLLVAASLGVLHQVDDRDGRWLEFQRKVLGNRGQRLAVERRHGVVRETGS